MKTGRAIGGPYDGIILTASDHWVGVIRKHTDGRYEWSDTLHTWEWQQLTRELPSDTNVDVVASLKKLYRSGPKR